MEVTSYDPEQLWKMRTASNVKPQIGDLYHKEGKRWRVTCTVADIYTIKCKTEERILSLPELNGCYRKHYTKDAYSTV